VDSVVVGELEIAYRRAGAGPPLLLVHGAATDGRSWDPQLTGLADSFDVIAWDEPGAGGSADPRGDFDLGAYADALASFVGALGLDRVHVAGLSWGGVLAQELCMRHPEVVGSLVLAGTYAGWKGSLSPAECRARVEFARGQAAAAPDGGAPPLPGLFGPDAPPELAAWLEAIGTDARPATLVRTATLLAECDLCERQREIATPCLLIWGEHDVRSPLDVAQSIHGRIADARLEVLSGAGHMTNLERPDLFNEAVRRFALPIAL
jgi:pimeloyl-ACP methyl ester carboxylesterase